MSAGAAVLWSTWRVEFSDITSKVAELALRRVGREVELLARDGHGPLVVRLGRCHLGGVVAGLSKARSQNAHRIVLHIPQTNNS